MPVLSPRSSNTCDPAKPGAAGPRIADAGLTVRDGHPRKGHPFCRTRPRQPESDRRPAAGRDAQGSDPDQPAIRSDASGHPPLATARSGARHPARHPQRRLHKEDGEQVLDAEGERIVRYACRIPGAFAPAGPGRVSLGD